jgi:hypothetical protein
MSPVLWGIIVGVVILIWIGSSFMFEPIGKAVREFFKGLFK